MEDGVIRTPKGRRKYDWTMLSLQFMMSDIADFRLFLSKMGYPKGAATLPPARAIAEKKRRFLDELEAKVRDKVVSEPMLERSQRRFKVLKELSNAGQALRACVMNRLIPDMQMTARQEGDTPKTWSERSSDSSALTSGELMALAIAQKHADDLIRKAEGLEDFDWEHEEKAQRAIAKATKLEFEIVQTTNGKPIAELPWAPEEKKGTA